ncbi:ketosteroid isomerase-like protein [Arthrobacter ulcerisalmonis]|uniref:nuclear transport factor 2 family protein n=1 Tax=Arthrobacter sp. B1I2 TaxID=3042263 RepID=UPI002783D4BC|nr:MULTISPECIES: nuclear transport factor 2 family protein [Arthrobacter]MDQ0665486.1 ketosteroid isomerase-like protein [Arthrobacter ulcerisalmonis]MDQ0733190.1 ketosteroid isomerase-like protein [Arthrobacter sp. B1I2]
MGQAREVMDRLMAAMDAKDKEALAGCFAADAVIATPDQGGISGREAIANYFFHFWEAMPDVRYEQLARHEAGDVAVVEGFVVGTNTGQLSLPTGGALPPTGKPVRVRSCDVARMEAGMITEHHAYFDQLELLGQLGLLPELSRQ